MRDGRDTQGVGPCETAWSAHFGVAELPCLTRERLVLAEGEVPLLVLPTRYDAEQRERACAWAVLMRYLKLFGQAELNWAVGLQHRLPEALAVVGAGEGYAAD